MGSSNITNDDILKELTIEECNCYLKTLKNFLPKYIHSHHYLYNHIRWLKKYQELTECERNEISDRCKTKVYGYRYGKPENCTFIGMSGVKDYWLLLFTLDEYGTELLECVKKTNFIDWKVRPFNGIMPGDEIVASQLDEIFKEKNLKIEKYNHDTVVYVSKEKLKELEIVIPDGVYLAPLEIHHAKIINKNWPHSYKNSLSFIESCIKLYGGTGVFRSDTNDLISWNMTSENYTSGFLYTIESERRKGYGKLVVAADNKRIAINDNLDVFGYILMEGKITPEKHVTKEIGYIPVNKLVWFEQE